MAEESNEGTIQLDDALQTALRAIRTDAKGGAPQTQWLVAGKVAGKDALTLLAEGTVSSVEEVKSHFQPADINFALMRIIDQIDNSATTKFVYIRCQPESTPALKKSAVSTKLGLYQAVFSPFSTEFFIVSPDEISQEIVADKVASMSSSSSTPESTPRQKPVELSEQLEEDLSERFAKAHIGPAAATPAELPTQSATTSLPLRQEPLESAAAAAAAAVTPSPAVLDTASHDVHEPESQPGPHSPGQGTSGVGATQHHAAAAAAAAAPLLMQQPAHTWYHRLLLGEGNFSFIDVLVLWFASQGITENIIATEYCSLEQIRDFHRRVSAHALAEFDARMIRLHNAGVLVLFDFDARDIIGSLARAGITQRHFDLIHFNMPWVCKGQRQGKTDRLVHDFFQAAQRIGARRIHMALVDDDYHHTEVYGTEKAASDAHYRLVDVWDFYSRWHPHGYTDMVSVGNDNTVHGESSREFVFVYGQP